MKRVLSLMLLSLVVGNAFGMDLDPEYRKQLDQKKSKLHNRDDRKDKETLSNHRYSDDEDKFHSCEEYDSDDELQKEDSDELNIPARPMLFMNSHVLFPGNNGQEKYKIGKELLTDDANQRSELLARMESLGANIAKRLGACALLDLSRNFYFYVNSNHDITQRVLNELHKIYLKETRECEICLDNKHIAAFVNLLCKHIYCRTCLEHMVNQAIHEKDTSNLKCPNPQCSQPINEQNIRNITNNNQNKIDLLADIMTHEWLVKQNNIKQCPTPDCSYVFINDQGVKQTVNCPKCAQQYCSGCLLEHSSTVTCQQAHDMKPSDEHSKSWLEQNTKACPKCKARIQKNGGCLYVQCKFCKHGFCWNCYGTHHVSTCNAPSVQQEKLQNVLPQVSNNQPVAIQIQHHVDTNVQANPNNVMPQAQPLAQVPVKLVKRQEQEMQKSILPIQDKRQVGRMTKIERRRISRRRTIPVMQSNLKNNMNKKDDMQKQNSIIERFDYVVETHSPVRILRWHKPIIASPSILAQDESLRRKQQTMPIWVTIIFDRPVTGEFAKKFYNYLNENSEKIRKGPLVHHVKFWDRYIIVVDNSMSQHEVQELLNKAFDYCEVEGWFES